MWGFRREKHGLVSAMACSMADTGIQKDRASSLAHVISALWTWIGNNRRVMWTYRDPVAQYFQLFFQQTPRQGGSV